MELKIHFHSKIICSFIYTNVVPTSSLILNDENLESLKSRVKYECYCYQNFLIMALRY